MYEPLLNGPLFSALANISSFVSVSVSTINEE